MGEDLSSSEDEDIKDMKLRKREHHNPDGKHHSHNSELREKKKESSKSKSSPHQTFNPRSNSVSDNSDVCMPELAPQVTNHNPKGMGSLTKEVLDSPKSYKKLKSGKEEKHSQKSIKEFRNNKSTVYDNFQSESSNDEEEKKTSKFELRLEKVQKHAIEKSYEANKDFLKTFESFEKGDKISSNKENKKSESKSYTLIASTLHPKKVVKEELKKRKETREDDRKRTEDDVKKKISTEEKSLKRKEREWEDAREQQEREEKLKKDKIE